MEHFQLVLYKLLLDAKMKNVLVICKTAIMVKMILITNFCNALLMTVIWFARIARNVLRIFLNVLLQMLVLDLILLKLKTPTYAIFQETYSQLISVLLMMNAILLINTNAVMDNAIISLVLSGILANLILPLTNVGMVNALQIKNIVQTLIHHVLSIFQ